MDYHRFDYPDRGKTIEADRIGGRFWTINWRALQNKPDILFQNERHIQILEARKSRWLGEGAVPPAPLLISALVARAMQRNGERAPSTFDHSYSSAENWDSVKPVPREH